MNFLLGLLLGLFIAWFFWPAPVWAQRVHAFLITKLPFLGGGTKSE
jgi:hypothetical protein